MFIGDDVVHTLVNLVTIDCYITIDTVTIAGNSMPANLIATNLRATNGTMKSTIP